MSLNSFTSSRAPLTLQPAPIEASPGSHVDMLSAVGSQRRRNSWSDYFLNYVPEDEVTQAQRQQEVDKLKEEVRSELLETIAHKPTLEQLELIDNIQRLGLGYHYEDEIEAALNQIYIETDNFCHGDVHHDLDLYHASLRFRLLRQRGFPIPCDIFKKFMDEHGNFRMSLSSDAQGLLSLYEASYLRVHGEDILDKALVFTTTQLKLEASKLAQPLAAKVAHALKQPLHKGVARLESRNYISLCDQNNACDSKLLKFAKLDYNLLQSLHKKELAEVVRWCYDTEVFTRLPYNIREVLVEIFYCGLGTMDERPEYSFTRIIYFKLTWIATVYDDIYDLCTIPDLELLTEAIQRWDKGCVDQLPDSLKFVYTKLLEIFEEVEQQLEAKKGTAEALQYAVESFKLNWEFHLQSSKWGREDQIFPTFDEYMAITTEVIGLKFTTIVAYVGLGLEIATHEVFEWARKYPKPMQALTIIARIEDDTAEDDPMEKDATIKPSALSCYMEQYKVTNKDQVYEELGKMLDNAWKDINQSMLRPTIVPMRVLERILTEARYLHVMFQIGDGFTSSDQTPMP